MFSFFFLFFSSFFLFDKFCLKQNNMLKDSVLIDFVDANILLDNY